MKVIAYYLPQFHEIPENNEWWGKGFTEWVNIKKATTFDKRQYQPRVPLNKNYYDLSDIEVMKWQADLAKKYGVYGFCIYHYWFGGHKLLEKPVENLLEHKEIDIHYCLCWANENWTNQWVSGVSGRKMLIEQTYGGEEEWEAHFNYLLAFFKDERYIKENNKPLLVIYRPDLVDRLDEMLEFWNALACKNGFLGICCAYQNPDQAVFNYANGKDYKFDYQIEFQPIFSRRLLDRPFRRLTVKMKKKIFRGIDSLLHTHKFSTIYFSKRLEVRNYEKDWEFIIAHIPDSDKCVPGAFVDWDNTPRRQMRGSFYVGANPEKFAYYFDKLVQRAKDVYKKDMIFIFAWNEWSEGGHLEPDEKNGYGYLEAIYQVLKENGELP